MLLFNCISSYTDFTTSYALVFLSHTVEANTGMCVHAVIHIHTHMHLCTLFNPLVPHFYSLYSIIVNIVPFLEFFKISSKSGFTLYPPWKLSKSLLLKKNITTKLFRFVNDLIGVVMITAWALFQCFGFIIYSIIKLQFIYLKNK